MSTQVYIPFSPVGQLSPISRAMSDPKERFYRRFQTEITAIQDQIEDLSTLSPIGGERQDCIDTVLAGISRLSNEVTDAHEYIPAYDQRTYAQAIKALTEKLNEATGKFAPKSRFQFKPRASKPAEKAQHDPRKLFSSEYQDETDADINTQDGAEDNDQLPELRQFGTPRNYNEEIAQGKPGASIRKPSFSMAKTISIYSQENLHIMLPASASRATSSGSLTDLERCIVDMTVPTSGNTGAPFAGLTVKNVSRSLLICGHVAGPVHITGVKNSIMVVAARQVRIHECENVDIYLFCASHPIIEDCKGLRFAPIPQSYLTDEEDDKKNQWDQVDDFKWLKNEPSPNWDVLPEPKRLSSEVWSKTVSDPILNMEEILRKAGI